MALLIALGGLAASTAYFNRQLLTLCVPHKFARLLLNVASAAGRLVDCPTLFWALPVALLDNGSVALFHHTLQRLLLECDLARFLKVLLADLLLGRVKPSDIGVVALFNVLVRALEYGCLLDGLDLVLVKDAPQPRLRVNFCIGEVNPPLHCRLPTLSVPDNLCMAEICPNGCGKEQCDQKSGYLKREKE